MFLFMSGVPQGTVLGPILFLLHINDLPSVVSSQVRLFADDCLLYRIIKSIKDCVALQDDLKSLEVWAKEWGMVFNAQKCYILSIRKRMQFFYQLYILNELDPLLLSTFGCISRFSRKCTQKMIKYTISFPKICSFLTAHKHRTVL